MHKTLSLVMMLLLATGCSDHAALHWYKGNTHTHTLWSDGDGAPELVARWYAQYGYNFLVLSDHNILSQGDKWFPISAATNSRLTPERVAGLIEEFGEDDVQTREVNGERAMRLHTLDELRAMYEEPGRFIFIHGEEITDHFDRQPVHVNGLNLVDLITPRGGSSIIEVMQNDIDAVIEHGRETHHPTLAHINHPNFGWALTIDDLAHIRGENYFEVYNGHRSVNNYGDKTRPGTEQMWDAALTQRLTTLHLGPLYGLATDDAHNHYQVPDGHSNPGRGWVMVRAKSLDADEIINAMHRGDFYASSGVTLDSIKRDGKRMTINIHAEPGVSYTTRFIGTRLGPDADGDGQPDVGIVGEVLAETMSNPASYKLTGDEVYVRAVIISSKEHPNPYMKGDHEMAWVQPVVNE